MHVKLSISYAHVKTGDCVIRISTNLVNVARQSQLFVVVRLTAKPGQ